MQSTPPVDVPTPQCDAFGVVPMPYIPGKAPSQIAAIGWEQFARALEVDLIAATAELAATKEQLRVAREAMEMARGGLDLGEYGAADETLANAITALTQPNLSADSLGGGNPAKGEGGVPLTFPA